MAYGSRIVVACYADRNWRIGLNIVMSRNE